MKHEIKLTENDLKKIHGEDYQKFKDKILTTCWCGNCSSDTVTTIVNYKIFLNDLDDVILRGLCKKCGARINRYLETGEVEKYRKIIKKIRQAKENQKQ